MGKEAEAEKKIDNNEQEIIERGNWTGRLDFILSCIGYAVGLGNVWRFPYLCFRNGGGAFLIPYAIMLFIAGIPLFFFELSFGQFASQGPITVWAANPMFMGVGWAMVMISAMVSAYYNVIIMYAIYYMMVSFVNLDTKLPWQTCDPEWATHLCRQEAYPNFASMTNDSEIQKEAFKIKDTVCLENLLPNISAAAGVIPAFATIMEIPSDLLVHNTSSCDLDLKVPSDEYWTRYVLRLHESDGFDEIGGLSLKLTICLFLAWVIIFFCLMKGVKSSGKVVYFTATFPYLVLIALLIRGLTLEGHEKGVEFYMTADWDKLKDPKVWGDAATQIFYSLGPAWGGLLTMSSYNRFKNNTVRDTFIVSIINCGTSVFAGFAVFSLLGFMATQLNRDVKDVVEAGPGLAFIAYPEGIARMPVASLWAFLFFFMIFTLGLDSQFAMMETVISGFVDAFPTFLRPKKQMFTLLCCLIGFLVGLPQVAKGGIYLLTLVDWYAGSYNLMLVSMAELIGICYIYGVNNFRRDIEMMLGKQHPAFWIYWYCTWCFITPVSIGFIVIMSAINYSPAYYGDYEFPGYAQAMGWLMVCSPLAIIIVVMIAQIIRKGLSGAVQSESHWGPALDEDRALDPMRYRPLRENKYPPNGHYTDNEGQTNIAYLGDEKVKYVATESNRM
ncbi:sodium- and chloride-dependent GABA transporter 1-like isoform X1 [Mytilus californianus]|uniref:sodium- and chloride-dependent GABA transporter 1-like isoform X1 n=1 Tax=Mytilus californianus TaxID=6549 RepID=UPI00224740CE|nr:sodium- and chloride-dependent GABA transporter 1-like isoform X1 [Mytilus californianus]